MLDDAHINGRAGEDRDAERIDTGGMLSQILYSFCVPLHISQDFGRGLIDTRHVVLYGSVALFCLFLTVRSLESRRWR